MTYNPPREISSPFEIAINSCRTRSASRLHTSDLNNLEQRVSTSSSPVKNSTYQNTLHLQIQTYFWRQRQTVWNCVWQSRCRFEREECPLDRGFRLILPRIESGFRFHRRLLPYLIAGRESLSRSFIPTQGWASVVAWLSCCWMTNLQKV